mmetsp:Transcript_92689/g.262093  ORF Transcript_92689/g.262093 Transcript_92689/m.262093 type:complete len:202 (+) Transcript_92689:539-1144(+)
MSVGALSSSGRSFREKNSTGRRPSTSSSSSASNSGSSMPCAFPCEAFASKASKLANLAKLSSFCAAAIAAAMLVPWLSVFGAAPFFSGLAEKASSGSGPTLSGRGTGTSCLLALTTSSDSIAVFEASFWALGLGCPSSQTGPGALATLGLVAGGVSALLGATLIRLDGGVNAGTAAAGSVATKEAKDASSIPVLAGMLLLS